MGCSSCEDCNDITLLSGEAGTNGSNGLFGGHSAKWKADMSTQAAPPGSGYIRFNNATAGSVTEIYVSVTNSAVTSMTNFLNTWNNGGSYGLIRFFKEYDDNIFWIGTITGITTVGTHHTLTVTHTASNGTFVTDDATVGTFTPKSEGIIGIENGVIATGTWIPGTTTPVPAASATGQYSNLTYTNSTGGSKTFKVDVSFNCGDAALASVATGAKACIGAGLYVNGVEIYTAHNFLSVVGGEAQYGVRQGQAFTVGVTVPNGQVMEVRFATSNLGAGAPENGQVNSATFYYRET